jgi:type VI protein secretion system component Hcp
MPLDIAKLLKYGFTSGFKWCRKSNDKTIYSKFQNLSLVVFDIDISVLMSHVTKITIRYKQIKMCFTISCGGI